MAGLQRSAISFRRQGSSGLVWDDKFLSTGEFNQTNPNNKKEAKEKAEFRELRPSKSVGSSPMIMERSRSNGGGRNHVTHQMEMKIKMDPPSPKLAGCGLCGLFGRPGGGVSSHQSKLNKLRRK